MADTAAIRTTEGAHRADAQHVCSLRPTMKRVRAVVAGQTIADSVDVMLMHESGLVPQYYFPKSDLRMELLLPTDHHTTCPYKGQASYWTFKLGNRVEENVAWAYPQPVAGQEGLADRIAFYFARLDHWYEEDDEIFGHVPDPYKRIDIRNSARRVQVIVGGETVADSTRARFLFETGVPVRYYLPADDVRTELLSPTPTTTYCPYKGTARYWSLTLGGKAYEDLIWAYPDPIPECLPVKDYLSFYWTKVDAILIDGKPAPEATMNPPKKIGGVGKPPAL